MRRIQIKTLITVGIVVFLAVGFGLAVAARFSNPTIVFDRAVRERGAIYLGSDGVVMQDKINTCGPAAVKMILEAYGNRVSLQELENGEESPRGGWSMRSLKELAEQRGVHAEGWRLNPDNLSTGRFPMILFIEDRHFVVVDSVDAAGFVFVRDPAIGRMKLHRRALAKTWKGEALVFGGDRIMVEQEHTKSTK